MGRHPIATDLRIGLANTLSAPAWRRLDRWFPCAVPSEPPTPDNDDHDNRERPRRSRHQSTQRHLQEGARAARPGADPGPLYRRSRVDRHGRAARPIARRLLAAGDRLFLPAQRRGRDLPEPPDAARGRPLSMGEAWIQRADRFPRRLEPVDLRDRELVRAGPPGHHVSFVRARARRPLDVRTQAVDRRHRLGADRQPGRRLGARPGHRQVGAQRRRGADSRAVRRDCRTADRQLLQWDAAHRAALFAGAAGVHAAQPEYSREDGVRRAWRFRVHGDCRGRVSRPGPRHRAIGGDCRADRRGDVHPRHRRRALLRAGRIRSI